MASVTFNLILIHVPLSKSFHQHIPYRFAVGDESFANNWLKKTTSRNATAEMSMWVE
jgi:hypothetical protein